MFSTTFLGHQGWSFRAGRTQLLVDPLLTPRFGHGGAVGAVYPPRSFAFEHFPPIDAVLLTHEHEDHFDVPSLARLDRRIPILLSANSSAAARAFLGDMGFIVRFVRGGERVTVGDLAIDLFAPDHVRAAQSDEWDVLQFVVHDRNGHGNFVSAVDCAMTLKTVLEIKRIVGRRGLWCLTNNTTHWAFLEGGDVFAKPVPTALAFAGEIAKEETVLRERWSPPAGILFCGGGWSFAPERAWLNHNAFPCDSQRAAEALAALLPGETVLAPQPGQTVHMAGGEITEVAMRTPYVGAPEIETWPSRTYRGDVELMADYEPACGDRTLTPDDAEELAAGLEDLARHLYGGPVFRGLCSLDASAMAGRKPAFALLLLTGEDREAYVLEYDPRGCGFVFAEAEDPLEDYVAGVECWGSDLLAAVRGQLAPTAIVFGRNRSWTHHPRELTVNGADLFWSYFHPLRRPAHFLDLYRHLLREAPAEAPSIPAAEGAEIRIRARSPTP